MSTPVGTGVAADVDREPIVTTVLSMAVIVLCACAVLVPYLGFRCVTVDEYATYLLVTTRSWREILEWVQALDTNPPTHYLLLRLWSTMFGDSLVTLRAMNILPTILSGLGAWWFLRRRKVSVGWAVAAGCSVVASPTLLYYSRVVRYYSWPACFGSMAVLSYAEWRRTERRSWLLLAGGLELVCGYFHYLAGVTIFVGVGVAMLLEWRRGGLRTPAWRRLVLTKCAVLGLMTPLVLWNVFGILAFQIDRGIQAAAVTAVAAPVLAALYIPYGLWFSENFFPWDWWFTVPAGLLGLAILRLRFKWAGSVESRIWFTTAAAGSVVAALVMTTLFRLEFRHTIVAVLWVGPLLLVWIWETLSLAPPGLNRTVVVLAMVAMQALGIHAYYSYRDSMYPDVNWRQVAAVLEGRATREDMVVTPGVANSVITGSLFDPYWTGPTFSVIGDPSPEPIESPGLSSFRAQLKQFKGHNVWMIDRTPSAGEALEVKRLLNAHGLTPHREADLFPRDLLARSAINSLVDKSVDYRIVVWRFAAPTP